ncbi:MAG: PrsW family intramembrane metalloprotease [Patescibacteria group bacterium]|nr:PrsW family intramembrane metalloprotease [Patescibacteria group bacterium]MDE1944349.1 PrsW family intramembrane metalloprotease [Patescibacteria group bacterium]MDE1945243.1 PrsW family intramembrane metalloprotease [Patescibacteria group bacterium]MDE2057685.1 PrsW family intramembrane metalloprotease [Patescibacteria group bacterium]
MNALTIGYAVIGGVLPALIWLYFLLKEDSRCPEPKGMIASAFVVGMLAVAVVLPFEEWTKAAAGGQMNAVLLSWAAIEEVAKYAMAAAFILWRRAVDEPTDYVIYMITVALGFAAAENALFLLSPVASGSVAASVATDDLRFLGSTLLHVVASASVGFALAAAAMHRPHHRVAAVSIGLILAIALHLLFNVLIINAGNTPALTAFFLVWTLAVVFFAALEVLKYFEYRNLPNDTCPT